MPTSYSIQPSQRRVACVAEGVVTLADLEGHYRKLGADRSFDRSYGLLWDLRKVTRVDHSAARLLEVANRQDLIPDGPRAVIVGDGEATKFMEIWVLHRRANKDDRIRLFKTPEDAAAWLDAFPSG